MNAIALGPVLISLPRLHAFVCALALLLVARFLLAVPDNRYRHWAWGLILAWVLGARLGHLALAFDSYLDAPLDALKLWQPGYNALAGLVAGMGWSGWAWRRELSKGLVASLLLILVTLAWFGLERLAPWRQSEGLSAVPKRTLEDIHGRQVSLSELAANDQKLLINLWATWCPPCLREMPLLESLDARDDLQVAVINQGEDLLPVVRYLDAQALNFEFALLDPRQQLLAELDAAGLPTSVLFDAGGKVLHRHVGELNRAQLERWLDE